MKRLKTGSFGLILVGALASTVLADGRVNLNANPAGSGGRYNGANSSGGAFEVTPRNDFHANQANPGYNGELGGLGLTNSFYTFCVERTEFLGNPQFSQIAMSASGGGFAGQDASGTDPLDARTAVLYREFRNDGNFGGIGNIGSLPVAQAQALTSSLQVAIWFIEDEIRPQDGTLYTGDADAVAMVAWATGQVAGGAGIGGVRILRMWDNHSLVDGSYSGVSQDVLTIIPLPPAAWAGLASLAGIAGLGYARRRSLRS